MRTATTAFLSLMSCGGAEASPREAPRASAVKPPTKTASRQVRPGLLDPSDAPVTPGEILAVVKARKADIHDCYATEQRTRPRLGGKLVVSWRIAADGTTYDVELRSTTLDSAAVEGCVLRQVSQLVFPPPRGDKRVRVNFPFIFEPGGE